MPDATGIFNHGMGILGNGIVLTKRKKKRYFESQNVLFSILPEPKPNKYNKHILLLELNFCLLPKKKRKKLFEVCKGSYNINRRTTRFWYTVVTSNILVLKKDILI